MAHFQLRSRVMPVVVAGWAAGTFLTQAPTAHADATAYLVNVTVRPGYHFASADAALEYGHLICKQVADNTPYRQLIARIQGDFDTADPYQGAYLVNQAVNELCPALIWQLRRTAATDNGPAAP